MIKHQPYRIAAGMAALTLFSGGKANAIDFSLFASLRFHAEEVSPDNDSTLDSYTGWRDAYSRFGFNATHPLSDSLTVIGRLELPLDLPNKAVQNPWDQEEDIYIGKMDIKGNFGYLSIGRIWLPYYNAIIVPFNNFSSYYSGFTTYSAFRKSDTIAYYSPSFGGFSGALGYSQNNGATKSNGDTDDRRQVTLSFNFCDITLAGGLDDLGGAGDSTILGTTLIWQATDRLYIAAKYEQYHSNFKYGYGADGDHAMNLYAAYTLGKNTFKVTRAEVEGFGETILHLGWDHQYQNDLKFFIEYYSEEETAVLTEERGGLDETCWICSGGQVILAGLRFDFRTTWF
jgi:predicted porin